MIAQNLSGNIILSNQKFSNLNILGVADLKNASTESLDIIGSLHFHKLNVRDHLSIIGTTNGNEGNFSKIDIVGIAKLKSITCDNLKISANGKKSKISIFNSLVNKEAELISTSVNIINSKFYNITINSDNIYLTDFQARHLLIDNNNSSTILNIIEKIEGFTKIDTIIFTNINNNIVNLPKKFKNNLPSYIKEIIGAKVVYN